MAPDTSLRAKAEAIAEQYLSENPKPGYHGRLAALGEPDKITTMLEHIRQGNYIAVAARAAGLSEQTFHRWRQLGEQQPDSPHGAFVSALKEAEAEAESAIVSRINAASKAGPQYWAAGATLLERRHPERWGKRQEDQQAPRVVVQIGVKDSDVNVQVGDSPALKRQTSGS